MSYETPLTVEEVPEPQTGSTEHAPRGTNSRSLRPLERIAVMLPPEAQLPISERVYAMDIATIDDPTVPTQRDLQLVERLGSLMCDPIEVIAITGMTKDQFNRSDAMQGAWARGRERAKARLRLMQWDAAAMGSERMLVHLGKQYLDQTERSESKNVTEDDKRDRATVRDKLADAINRAAEKRVSGGADGGRAGAIKEVVAALGEGQSTPAAE